MRKEDIGKLILRVATGGLMLFHGVHKMAHGIEFIAERLRAHHLPGWIAYGVFLGEILAPILLILGWMTRPAAFLMAFTMFMSIYLVFGWSGFNLDQIGVFRVELNLFFLLAALSICFLGAGRYAVGKGGWD
jgi:putative oxidoreductase